MHPRCDFHRTVILGNSGAGKSWLADRLSHQLAIPAIDLDEIYWEPGGYKTARDRSLSAEMVREASKKDRWVIEGVYGRLAREALPNATTLVWLDIDEWECIANLQQRGIRGGGDEASFSALVKWAGAYRLRDHANSFAGHQRIVSGFVGSTIVLHSRSDITALLKSAVAHQQS